jgi:antitoxin component YwqK of YwqJK toxin-antitoxin module
MKTRRWLGMAILLSISGCGGEDIPQTTTREEGKKAVKAVDVRQRTDSLITPKPIKALSEIGHVTPTPEFIKAQKIEQKYPNGQSQRELTIHFYKNGPNLFHGEFKEWHPNGTLWKQGTYNENRRVGEWKFFSESGEQAKHAFYNKDGLPDGEWIYYRNDGSKRREENYRNGQRHGQEMEYGKDGVQLLSQQNFEDDKRHGKIIRWYPTEDSSQEPRKQFEAMFIEGKRDGTSVEWDTNGIMRNKVEFKEGKRNGRTQRWDTEGNLDLDLQFLDGEPVETTTLKDDSETAKDNSDPSDAEK